MTIICHYNSLHPRTYAALIRHSYIWKIGYVDTSGSETAYWESIASMWNMGSDLVLIEQDIEIHGGVFPEFHQCPESWCVFPYSLGAAVRETAHIQEVSSDGSMTVVQPPPGCIYGNGCTRYAVAAQRLVTPAQIQEETSSQWGWGNWRDLDSKLSAALLRRGLTPHIHQPNVEHWRGDTPLLFLQL